MTERLHLLPDSASRLERALSESMDRLPELGPGASDLRGFKFDPIDRIVPYLILEYGLTEIEDYLPDLRTVLREGLSWQRLRGTPAALHQALRWISHDGDIEEMPPQRFKWWWFQVHLPFEVRSVGFVGPMTALAKASKPLRSEFARVTAGYDKRAFRLNVHRLNGGALLNSWSGVRRAPGEPVLSLRIHQRERIRLWPADAIRVRTATHLTMPWRAVYDLPSQQRLWMFAALSGGVTRLDEPATQTFQNAPFLSAPFGTPPFRAHIGFS